jgi:hypothetical protein
MWPDLEKTHIETEKRFYKNMNKQKSFLLSLIIVGLGSLLLYFQYLQADYLGTTEFFFWTLFVGVLFVSQTLIGYYVFEYERKKYIGK